MISVVQLGTVDYAAGLKLQHSLLELRHSGRIPNVLLLLEHPPVITLGRNAKRINVVAASALLERRRVEVFECDRGGDVTFHGPGQLVGYPIFDLRSFRNPYQFPPPPVSEGRASVGVEPFPPLSPNDGESILQPSPQPGVPSEPGFGLLGRKTLGAVDYVRCLEEALIRTCADFGVTAGRIPKLTGVWTQAKPDASTPGEPFIQAKLAAIGVHISRGITSHGFALNVNTDLEYFKLIVPCGLAGKPVTSLAKETGAVVSLNAVAEAVARNFGRVFNSQILWVDTLDALLGHAVGVPLGAPEELRKLHEERRRLHENETFWA
jgi:lipoyl(octanoyl) transferase